MTGNRSTNPNITSYLRIDCEPRGHAGAAFGMTSTELNEWSDDRAGF